MMRKLVAEFIGTGWLVLGGCGSAVLAAAYPDLGIGFLGVALAFGLTVVTMAYAIGHISGCHLNPAVTVGLWTGGRFPIGDVIPYIAAQVLGGILVLVCFISLQAVRLVLILQMALLLTVTVPILLVITLCCLHSLPKL